MGYSKKDAEKMAAALIAIPNVTRTAKLQANKKDLETKLAAAETALKNPNLTATKKAQLKAEIANLKAGIAEADRLLKNLPSSKTITIKYTSNGIPRTFLPGSSTPGRSASGGPVQPRRTYLVGERGPEYLTMGNSPGRVTSAEAGVAPAGGGDTYVYVEIDGEQLQGRITKTVKQSNRDLKRTVGAR
jgi:hypothetical protein